MRNHNQIYRHSAAGSTNHCVSEIQSFDVYSFEMIRTQPPPTEEA